MFKAVPILLTTVVLCAPAFAADNQSTPQPKGKRPTVSFGVRDIQSQEQAPPPKKAAPAAAPASTKPAKSAPHTKTY